MEKDIVCELKCIHAITVAEVKKLFLPTEEQLKLAEIFKTLGDATRLRILEALSIEELCVCDLAFLLEISESAVSHQLRVLRNLRIVKYRKSGKIVYYSLDDEHIRLLFNQGLEHVRHGWSKSNKC